MKRIIFMLMFALIFTSCDFREKEIRLQNKEAQLNQKEQELLLKEKDLQLREERLASQNKPDSADSSFYNPLIIGTWSVKMQCTETSCTGSAVGDTKNETWKINYVENKVVAQAMTGDQVTRIYTGNFTGHMLELVESNEFVPGTKMIVTLRITSDTEMEGKREIVRENCRIIYSLQLTK